MAETIEASQSPDTHTICTVKATWGEFVIDADKAAEAVAGFLSHYYRSRMGGYSLSNDWIEEAAIALSKKCVIRSVEDKRANFGGRV